MSIALPRKQDAPFALPMISPSIDGRAIENRQGDPLLHECSAALDEAKAAAEKARHAAQLIHDCETMTIPARHVRAQETTGQITKPALQAIDRVRGRIEAEIARLETATRAPAPPRDALASEIRARLSAMDEKTRRATLAHAVNGGDDILGAVLGAPPFLSGVAPEEIEHYRQQWRQKRHAPEVERIDALQKGLAHIERGGNLLQQFWVGCFSTASVEEAKRAEAAIARATTH